MQFDESTLSQNKLEGLNSDEKEFSIHYLDNRKIERLDYAELLKVLDIVIAY